MSRIHTLSATGLDALTNRTKLQKLAQQYLLSGAGLDDISLIRRIQLLGHHFDCFATPRVKTCNEVSCTWRQDCIAKNASNTT